MLYHNSSVSVAMMILFFFSLASLANVSSEYKEMSMVKDITLDQHYGGTFCLQFNFDGTRLAAGFSGGGIRVSIVLKLTT